MTFFEDVATIARRELLRYAQERLFVFAQVLLPVAAVLVIGFAVRSPVGRPGATIDYTSFLAAGVLMLTLSSAAVGGGFTLIEDVERGFLRPILVAPVSRASIVVGKILARLLLSLVLAVTMLGVLALFTPFALPHPVVAAYALAAITFGFVALGLLLAIALGRLESFRTIATLVTVPLYLLSGIFFPVESLPGPLRLLALANPLTYGVDLFRYGTTGLAEIALPVDLIVTGALAVVPTLLAAWAFDSRLMGSSR